MDGKPEPQVQDDVPCLRCEYNLRGLSERGLCPECGHAINATLADRARQRRENRGPLSEADAPWVRGLREGAICAVVAVVMLLTVALGPRWMHDFHSPQRKVTLALACTAWVLSWASSWKLSAREPHAARDAALRVTLRWGATVYLAMPFLWACMKPSLRGALAGLAAPLCVISAAVGLLVTPAWLWYAGRLARRAGMRASAIEARVLAIGHAAIGLLLFFWPYPFDAVNSLELLTESYIVPLGTSYVIAAIVEEPQELRDEPIVALIALAIVWTIVLLPRLCVGLARAASRAASSKIA